MAEHKKPEPLSSIDTAWLRMEHPTNLMMITGVLMFDVPIDFERLRATIEQRMLRFDRFRQRVRHFTGRSGQPEWEDDPHFDIRSHVRRIALPVPGDEDALQELVGDLMSTPLDYSKPLWQWHLVEGYGRGCAVIARMHHCIADGIALVHVMLSLTDAEPDAPWPGKNAEKTRNPKSPLETWFRPVAAMVDGARRTTEAVVNQGMGVLSSPSKVLEFMQMGGGTVASISKLATMPPDPITAFKGKLGVPKRAVWSRPIPLEQVKAVGHFTKSTINDLLLTAVTGALRRYLQQRGERTDGLNIRAVVPVNLRPLSEAPRLGNRFGLVFLSLPVGIEDPLDCLLELQERMDAIKGSPEAAVAFGILNAIGTVPRQIEDSVINLFGTKATGVMTNVPGPRHPIYLAGKRLKGVMFWVPQSGRLGLGVSILSYAGEVRLGIVTDVALVPDPERIIAGFHDEFDHFNEMVQRAERVQSRQEQAVAAGQF